MHGSFWETDLGEALRTNQKSQIDLLLENPNCTLSELLDCEELIQEITARNGPLIEFISKEKIAGQLLSLITVPPDLPPNHKSNNKTGYFSFLSRTGGRSSQPSPNRDPFEPDLEAFTKDLPEAQSRFQEDEEIWPSSNAATEEEKPIDDPFGGQSGDFDPFSPTEVLTFDSPGENRDSSEVKKKDSPDPFADEETSSKPVKKSNNPFEGDDDDEVFSDDENPTADDPWGNVGASAEVKFDEPEAFDLFDADGAIFGCFPGRNSVQVIDPEKKKTEDLLRRPYVAAEVIRMDIEPLCNIILDPTTGLMDQLFSFLDTYETLDHVFACYFQNAVTTLYRKSPEAILAFLRSDRSKVKMLARHIGTNAIMELIGTLAWENPYDKTTVVLELNTWLQEGGFIKLLIEKLSGTQDEQNQSYCALVDIMEKSPGLQRTALMVDIMSEETIRAIMGLALPKDNQPSLYALRVLQTMLSHHMSSDFVFSRDDSRRDSESKDEIPEELRDFDLKCDEISDPLISAMREHIPIISNLLETPPDRPMLTAFGKLDPPLGQIRLRIMQVLMALVRTPLEAVAEPLTKAGVIPISVNLFFQYPWNNLLHGVVERIILAVIESEVQVLHEELFEKARLLERIIAGFEENAKSKEDKRKETCGYSGHLTRISYSINTGKAMLSPWTTNEKWRQFMSSEAMKEETEKQNRRVTGAYPEYSKDTEGGDDLEDGFFDEDGVTPYDD